MKFKALLSTLVLAIYSVEAVSLSTTAHSNGGQNLHSNAINYHSMHAETLDSVPSNSTYVQHYAKVDDHWYKSPILVNVKNETETRLEFHSQLRSHSLQLGKRWNPVLVEFTFKFLGGTLVSGAITLGQVVGAGAIAAAGALVWKGIQSVTTVQETTASSKRDSEDIFVDINVDAQPEVSEENGDPDDLEQRAMQACAQSINDQGGSGGCCDLDLQDSGNNYDIPNVVGLVEAGVTLNCPRYEP